MAARQTPYYELYRKSTVGEALTDTLDDMLQNNFITPQFYEKMLNQFDKSINEALANTVKTKITFKGNLHTYRFCDNVWTFIIDKAEFKIDDPQKPITVDRVKIVACDANVNETATGGR
ncbi:hypothetical protein CYY_005717 [Polysphondylium violaceum]|uniref:Transcription initiation factor IIA subunit 2 n=1 Tax=Polysphondylium violaceum TaxID=133409 RepID=A0A8J4V3W5_9MYCE|nr:hypothetical protein CYY_005717 [Polysphondylium violaceum]